jgi:predicted nucleotidyltransferase
MFAGLRKVATAKKQEKAARLKSAPKYENKNYDHFTPISGQTSALPHRKLGTFQTSSYGVGEHPRFLNIDINKPVNLVVKGEEVQKEIPEDLTIFFRSEKKVSVAYLFGSHAKKTQTPKSDIDIAVLLSEMPKKLLEYYLYLVNKLSEILGNNVDLIILNTSPPLLKHQVIKHGKIIYSQNEEARVTFEARAQSEYLDFGRAITRYNECFMKQILS